MKKCCLFILLLAVVSVSLSQTQCSIKKAHAWFNVSMPGNIMTDENGNPVKPRPHITRFVYVEYSGTKAPEINKVLYNNTLLDFTVVKIKEKIISIGDKKLNPGKTISVKKGNTFLKINLQATEGKTMPDPDCRDIAIHYTIAKKPCKFNLVRETPFATLPAY